MDGEVKKLLQKIGMQNILQGLIDELDTKEDYVQKLRADLETALKNYKGRYDNEED